MTIAYAGGGNYLVPFAGIWPIDTSDDDVGSPIDVTSGSYPLGGAVTPNGRYVVFSWNGVGYGLVVIDTMTDTPTSTSGMLVYQPKISRDGSLTAAYVGSGPYSFAWLSVPSLATVGSIYVGSDTGVDYAFSPDVSVIYQAVVASGIVNWLDVATETVIHTSTPVDDEPLGLALSPDGSTLYVGGVLGNVYVYDAATYALIDTITGLPTYQGYCLVLSPDGSTLYVSTYSGTGTITVIDTASRTITTNITLGGVVEYCQFGITSDGAKLFIPVLGIYGVQVIDTTTNSIVDTLTPTYDATSMAFLGVALTVPVRFVSSVNPPQGLLQGGQTVFIRGGGFTGASAVMFGSDAAESFKVVSDSEIIAVTPAHSSGTVTVSVL